MTPGPRFAKIPDDDRAAIMCQQVSTFLLHDTFIVNTASNSQIITIVDRKVGCMHCI